MRGVPYVGTTRGRGDRAEDVVLGASNFKPASDKVQLPCYAKIDSLLSRKGSLLIREGITGKALSFQYPSDTEKAKCAPKLQISLYFTLIAGNRAWFGSTTPTAINPLMLKVYRRGGDIGP